MFGDAVLGVELGLKIGMENSVTSALFAVRVDVK